MKKFIDRVEKGLIRFIVLALVILVIAQGAMSSDTMRFYLSWGERMEGQVINLPTEKKESEQQSAGKVESPYAIISLSVQKYSALPKAEILVNGEKAGTFASREVEIRLMAGDVVEIDSTAYNFPVEYKVESHSENLAYPRKGQTFTANQTIVMIGEIIVK